MPRWKRMIPRLSPAPFNRSCKGHGTPDQSPDWTCLPDPAVYVVMRALLPDLTDVASAACVCKAWRSVFETSKRALLSSMPPLAITPNMKKLGGLTTATRWSRRKGGLTTATRWSRRKVQVADRRVLGASHGYLFFAYRADHYQLFLSEAIGWEVAAGAHLISLPRLPFAFVDSTELLTMTAPPTSPKCVVVVVVERYDSVVDPTEHIVLYCRIGDDRWTKNDAVYYSGDNDAAAAAAASMLQKLSKVPNRLVVTCNGKLYCLTRSSRVLVVDAFYPRLSISVLDVKGFPRKRVKRRGLSCRFLVESGGEILFVVCNNPPEPDDKVDYHYRYEFELAAFRLDLTNREWVRADGLLKCSSRALLLHYASQSLSWDAAGSGDEGCIYVNWIPDMSSTFCVYHVKRPFEARIIKRDMLPTGSRFFLPGARN